MGQFSEGDLVCIPVTGELADEADHSFAFTQAGSWGYVTSVGDRLPDIFWRRLTGEAWNSDESQRFAVDGKFLMPIMGVWREDFERPGVTPEDQAGIIRRLSCLMYGSDS